MERLSPYGQLAEGQRDAGSRPSFGSQWCSGSWQLQSPAKASHCTGCSKSAPRGPWVLAPAASLPSFRKRQAMFTGHLALTLQSPGQSAGCLPTAKPSMAKWTHDVYFRHHPSHTFLSPTSQETLLWLEEGGEKGFENINIWKEQFQAGEGNVEMVMSSSLQRTLASFETRPPH